MIDWKKYRIFGDNISTLKEISKDDSDAENIEYMTDSLKEAIDFDAVKTTYTNELKLSEENASSVDGIFEVADHLFFIEFKNGNMKNQKRSVKDKIRDSLLIFCDITGKQVKDTREELEFILVYNIEKNPIPNQLVKKETELQESMSRINIAKYFSGKGKKEFIRFDLEKFKELYFYDIHTYSKEEFEKYLKEHA